MHPFLLLAALSSQITFDTMQDGEIYTITPQVMLTQSCVCQVQISAVRSGKSGKSTTRQTRTIHFSANQLTSLSRISMNISAQDSANITVTIADGTHFQLSREWSPEEKM